MLYSNSMRDLLPEDWSILRSWLPSDLQGLARRHRFIRRARGVQDAETWLRMLLMHVAGGLSLEQTVMRAREMGLARVSAVALFKRLAVSAKWLSSLTEHVLATCRKPQSSALPLSEIRIVDATDVREPGSSGSDWRVHYSIRLADLSCDHYQLTSTKEGERLGRFTFHKGEIVLADRGYANRAGAAHVLESQADLVVRLNSGAFPLEDEKGQPVRLPKLLRGLRPGRSTESEVYFVHDSQRYRLRLCAQRKGQLATLRSRRQALRKASGRHEKVRPDTLFLAGYMLVLTSLPRSEYSTEQVLCLYTQRWQIELVFKRFKQLLGLGHLPKRNDASAAAWMQAKILTALLVERVLHQGAFFSPSGFNCSAQSVASVSGSY
jgi:hypothetical protein